MIIVAICKPVEAYWGRGIILEYFDEILQMLLIVLDLLRRMANQPVGMTRESGHVCDILEHTIIINFADRIVLPLFEFDMDSILLAILALAEQHAIDTSPVWHEKFKCHFYRIVKILYQGKDGLSIFPPGLKLIWRCAKSGSSRSPAHFIDKKIGVDIICEVRLALVICDCTHIIC